MRASLATWSRATGGRPGATVHDIPALAPVDPL